MKHILCIGFCIFFNFHGFTQDQQAILMQNTKVIRGEVVRDSTDELLILLPDTSFLRVSKEKVYCVVEDSEGLTDRQLKKQSYKPLKGVSFRVLFSMEGALFTEPDVESAYGGFTLIPAVQFGSWLSVGVGTGYKIAGDPERIVPAVIDLRLSWRTRITPILAFGTGKTYSPREDWSEVGDMHYGYAGLEIKNFKGGSFALMAGIDLSPRYESIFAPPTIAGQYLGERVKRDVTSFMVSLVMKI